jgi:hypothetical protein
MARQPFRRPSNRDLSLHWGNQFIKPALAAIIGRCILYWTQNEFLLSSFLGVLLKTNTPAAMSVFLTLRRSSNRSEAITVASKHLPEREAEICAAALKVIQAAEAERNDLVHGMFGIADHMPDAILWAEVKDISSTVVRHIFFADSADNKDMDNYLDAVSYYRENDLLQIEERIKESSFILHSTTKYIRGTYDLGPSDPEIAEQYSQLCSLAPIAEALRVLRARAQQNTQAGPPQS